MKNRTITKHYILALDLCDKFGLSWSRASYIATIMLKAETKGKAFQRRKRRKLSQ